MRALLTAFSQCISHIFNMQLKQHMPTAVFKSYRITQLSYKLLVTRLFHYCRFGYQPSAPSQPCIWCCLAKDKDPVPCPQLSVRWLFNCQASMTTTIKILSIYTSITTNSCNNSGDYPLLSSNTHHYLCPGFAQPGHDRICSPNLGQLAQI